MILVGKPGFPSQGAQVPGYTSLKNMIYRLTFSLECVSQMNQVLPQLCLVGGAKARELQNILVYQELFPLLGAYFKMGFLKLLCLYTGNQGLFGCIEYTKTLVIMLRGMKKPSVETHFSLFLGTFSRFLVVLQATSFWIDLPLPLLGATFKLKVVYILVKLHVCSRALNHDCQREKRETNT